MPKSFIATIFALSAAVAVLSPVLALAAPSTLFPRNLELYDSGSDVRQLQQFLNAHGYLVAASGPGSPGQETTLFGLRTYRALKEFQAADGLPATGFLGPLTRAEIGPLSAAPSPAAGLHSAATSSTPVASSSPICSAPPGFTCIPGTSLPQPSGLSSGYTPGFGGGGPDITPPTVSISAPSGGSTVSGTAVTLSAAASDNIGVASVQFQVDGTNVSSPWNSTSVTDGTHTITALATDAVGNSASARVSVTVDNTPPVRSGGSPAGVLAFGTSSTTLSVITSETATCHYSATSGTTYASGTVFSTTGSTSHSTTVTGLANNQAYTYYVRCQDAYGNTNGDDFPISFSTAPAMTLSANSFAVAAASSTVIATVQNVISGATLSLTTILPGDTGKISLSGNQLVVGAGSSVPWSIGFSITETAPTFTKTAYFEANALSSYTLSTPALFDNYSDVTKYGFSGTGSKSQESNSAFYASDATTAVTITGPTPGVATGQSLTRAYTEGSALGPNDLNGMAMWVYQQSTGQYSSSNTSGAPNGTSTVTNIQVGLRIGLSGSTINEQIQSNQNSLFPGGRWVSYAANDCNQWSVACTASASTNINHNVLMFPVNGSASPGVVSIGPTYYNAKGRPTVILTFDDGYESQYTTILPLLEEYGMVGTFFPAPNLVALGNASNYLSVDQLNAIFQAGNEIGNDSPDDNSYVNPNFYADQTAALAGLAADQAWIIGNGWNGPGINFMDWPFGEANPTMAAAFHASGGILAARGTGTNTSFYSRFGLSAQQMMFLPWYGVFSYSGNCSTANANSTITALTNALNKAVADGNTIIFTIHDVRDDCANLNIDVTTALFTGLLNAIQTLRNAGSLDVLTFSEWYARDGAATPP